MLCKKIARYGCYLAIVVAQQQCAQLGAQNTLQGVKWKCPGKDATSSCGRYNDEHNPICTCGFNAAESFQGGWICQNPTSTRTQQPTVDNAACCTLNRKGALHCRTCGQQAAPSPPQQTTPPTQEQLIAQGWTCKLCTFKNNPGTTTCHLCHASPCPDNDSGWRCKCGQKNTGGSCFACGKQFGKQNVVPFKKMDTHKGQHEYWLCRNLIKERKKPNATGHVCGARNSNTRKTCYACDPISKNPQHPLMVCGMTTAAAAPTVQEEKSPEQQASSTRPPTLRLAESTSTAPDRIDLDSWSKDIWSCRICGRPNTTQSADSRCHACGAYKQGRQGNEQTEVTTTGNNKNNGSQPAQTSEWGANLPGDFSFEQYDQQQQQRKK